jgi:hypothetical protein
VANLGKLINACRLCGSGRIEKLLDFGKISLTGLFLSETEVVPKAELTLAKCLSCHLVQLNHSYPRDVLYGANYGYESHLSNTMLSHLSTKAKMLSEKYLRSGGEIVVDIASNDGSFLDGFLGSGLKKVAIDPIINHLTDHYPEGTIKIPDFFSAETYWQNVSEPANLVTSLSVLYDLDQPLIFARDVYDILQENGIWHLEQSYLPSMVETTSYDTICHEHLLYLSMHNLKTILETVGFSIIEVSTNDVNGGSIAVTAIKKANFKARKDPFLEFLLQQEIENGFTDGRAMHQFTENSFKHKENLGNLMNEYKNLGFEIYGLGASTKGNVLLQWAEIDNRLIRSIGEINPRKFGKVTPGTNIKIINEKEILNKIPKKSGMISLVLPWHFRSGITTRSEKYLSHGGKLLFPLPKIQCIGI